LSQKSVIAVSYSKISVRYAKVSYFTTTDTYIASTDAYIASTDADFTITDSNFTASESVLNIFKPLFVVLDNGKKPIEMINPLPKYITFTEMTSLWIIGTEISLVEKTMLN
jgi:hypothetical protein